MSDLPEMPCRELVERVTDYLEGAIGPEDRARLEAHLEACDPCAVYLEQLRTTLRLAGSLRPEHVTDEMREDLQRAFDAWRAAGG